MEKPSLCATLCTLLKEGILLLVAIGIYPSHFPCPILHAF
eukprot:COSAG05_NODE_2967_length_2458_cov_1.609580_4_plen_40_part_00